jgi:hypothetical protein
MFGASAKDPVSEEGISTLYYNSCSLISQIMIVPNEEFLS